MKSRESKYILLIIVAVVVYTIFVSGITFFFVVGEDNGVYSYGTIDDCLSYDLEDIELNTSWPMSDDTALKSLEGYSFTVTNNCSIDIDYAIALEALSDEENTNVAYDYLKVGVDMNQPMLYRQFYKMESSLLDLDDDATVAKKLYTSNILANSTNNHIIKLWFDEATPISELNKTFNGRVKIVYGNKIINDKKSIKLPVSFATDSWDTISTAIKRNLISNYHIGDEKEVDMGKMGVHTLRISNMDFSDECYSNDFSISACGFVVEFKDIISYHNMNSNSTNNGGWIDSSMRRYLNNDVYRYFPADLKQIIVDTRVVSNGNVKDNKSIDKLYLLSYDEVYGNKICDEQNVTGVIDDININNVYTRQLDYYSMNDVSCANYSFAIKNCNSNIQWND